jgi:sugar O-acyltransferase (sialic acid O-acetyltransferase NeuD family)
MKKAIIGAGGFAREVMAQMGQELVCFVDDQYASDWYVDDNILPLSKFDPTVYEVVVAIGDPKIRSEIISRLPKETKYFTFKHPSAQILGNDVNIGQGSIICAGVIITTNIVIGDHAHLNLQTTIGHDCRIGNYFTTAPGAKISGNCNIQDFVYIGTNASVKEKINICNSSTIGLNAGVVKHITESGTYIGTPAKKIK